MRYSAPTGLRRRWPLNASPGARAYYDQLKARDPEHHAACANSPTGSSASCTAASKPVLATTKRPRGPIVSRTLQLDIQAPGMSHSCIEATGVLAVRQAGRQVVFSAAVDLVVRGISAWGTTSWQASSKANSLGTGRVVDGLASRVRGRCHGHR